MTGLDKLDKVKEIIQRTNEMSEIKRQYISAVVDSMLADDSGSVTEKIERHLAGERVTTEYLNLQTGETIEVPMDQEPPPGCIPLLGEINGGEVKS